MDTLSSLADEFIRRPSRVHTRWQGSEKRESHPAVPSLFSGPGLLARTMRARISEETLTTGQPKPNRTAAAESIAASNLRNRVASLLYVSQCIPFGLGGRPSPTAPVPPSRTCKPLGAAKSTIGHQSISPRSSVFNSKVAGRWIGKPGNPNRTAKSSSDTRPEYQSNAKVLVSARMFGELLLTSVCTEMIDHKGPYI